MRIALLLLLNLAHAAPADCARQPATCGCPTPFPDLVPYQVTWGVTRTEYRALGTHAGKPMRAQICTTGDEGQTQYVDIALEGARSGLFEDVVSGLDPKITLTLGAGVSLEATWRDADGAHARRQSFTSAANGWRAQPAKDTALPTPKPPSEEDRDAWLFWAATAGADESPPAEKTDAFARVVCRHAWWLQGQGRAAAGAALIKSSPDVMDRLDAPNPCAGLAAHVNKAPPATADDVAWALEQGAPALALRVADSLDQPASKAHSARIIKALARLMTDPRAPDLAPALTYDDGFVFAGMPLQLSPTPELESIAAAAQDPDILAALTERSPKRASAWLRLGQALLATHAPSDQIQAAFTQAVALGAPRTEQVAAWLRLKPLQWRTVSGWQISEPVRYGHLRDCQRAVCKPGPLCPDQAPDQPARCVDHAAAVAYAKAAGAQLPIAVQAKHWGQGDTAFWTATCDADACTLMTPKGAVQAPATLTSPHVGIRLVRPPR